MTTSIQRVLGKITLLFGVGFLFAGPAHGQKAPSTAQQASTLPSQTRVSQADSSALLQAFHQEQIALAQENKALIAQGATQEQIEAWREKNAARFAAQQERAQQLASISVSQPMPLRTDVRIPPGASQELIDFLNTQQTLYNNRAQLHNQNLAAGSSAQSVDEATTFQQQNAALLEKQTQQAQNLAVKSAQTPIPAPPPLEIPPHASTAMQAYLTLHDQVRREEIAVQNQYTTATPEVREAALEQWHQQNAARFDQLTQQAKNLPASTQTNPQGQNP